MSNKNRLTVKGGVILHPHDQRVIENLSMSAKHLFRKQSNLLVNIFMEDNNRMLPRVVVDSWRKEYDAVQDATALLN